MPAAAAERALARLTIGHYMLRRWSLEEDVRHLERLGFRSISLASTKFDAYGPARAIRLLRASSLRVAHLHQLGGEALFVLSGGREGTSWERAAGVYRDAYAALLPEATAAGIRLAIEVIHPLRQDISFINMLVDAREIARAAGRRGGYVLDFFHSGWEPRLLDTIRRDARRRIHAVQMCDYKRVTMRTMDRALLGKGILPLPAIFRALEQGGYRGWYEAEIISDDLEAMGYERALRQTRTAFVRLLG